VGQGCPDLADTDLVAAEENLRRRLAWAEHRVDLPAGRYETVLPPAAMADLMIFMSAAMGGRDAEDGRSVFSAPAGHTRVGESLSPTPFELRSDPQEPSLACAPFLVTTASSRDLSVFDNGLSLEPTWWLSEGRLERLRYHRAGATRSRVPPAPPIDNLVLEVPGSTRLLDEMVRSTDRGLLLTCLWYIRPVDPATLLLTGLTRDGVYLVEQGEVVGAVNNFRFNESPVDLLARATEVGRTEPCLAREANEWLSRTAMPPLRIPDFNMSTVSPAS
jgi:predicted Zn-dependent protease